MVSSHIRINEIIADIIKKKLECYLKINIKLNDI
jgi:hypothetical protein